MLLQSATSTTHDRTTRPTSAPRRPMARTLTTSSRRLAATRSATARRACRLRTLWAGAFAEYERGPPFIPSARTLMEQSFSPTPSMLLMTKTHHTVDADEGQLTSSPYTTGSKFLPTSQVRRRVKSAPWFHTSSTSSFPHRQHFLFLSCPQRILQFATRKEPKKDDVIGYMPGARVRLADATRLFFPPLHR